MLLGAINKSSPTDYGPWMTLRLTGTPKNTMPNATKALTLTPPAQPMSPLLRFLTRCLNHNLSHFKALSLLDRLIFKNISIVGDNGATDLWKGQRNPVRLVGGTRGSVYSSTGVQDLRVAEKLCHGFNSNTAPSPNLLVHYFNQ